MRNGSALIRKAIAGIMLLLVSDAAAAQVQQHTFKDKSGRTVGRSVTDTKGNTIYYDSMGRNTGRSTTSNGTTTTYDPMGRQTGTVKKGR